MDNKYAVIDLGSNSIRMNLLRIDEDGGYILFDQSKEMVRLSEGMDKKKVMQKEPMDRTIYALKLFKNLLKANKVTKVDCLATAAVRMATNQSEFLDRVKNETGFEFKVLTGTEEAYYDYLGVINSIDIQSFVMIDIGGGSTEIAYVRDRKIVNSISIPVGSVILTERFMKKSDPQGSVKKIKEFIEEKFRELDWLKEGKGLPIVGLGGVVRTVAKVDLNLNNHQLIYMHNYRMDKGEIEKVLDLLINSDTSKLKKLQGVNKDRADIMTAGIMPLEVLYETLGSDMLVISGNGLRDGYFYEDFFGKKYNEAIVDDVLKESLNNIKKLYSINIPHSENVRRITMKLYDSLKDFMGLSEEDRKILDVASQLHDIGMYVEYYNHHIHGFYLTLNSRLNGLTNSELISVALLVGSHRDKSMKRFWGDYATIISKERYDEIARMSHIIKLAEKLDRSESGVVGDLIVYIDDMINIGCISTSDPELEISSAMTYSSNFKKVFGKELRIYRA